MRGKALNRGKGSPGLFDKTTRIFYTFRTMDNMKKEKVSSGISYLDRLINCFNIGDNVIWQVEAGAFVELFCRAFIRDSVKENKDVVYVSFNNSPKNILSKIGPSINNGNVVIVDCFTSGKGENSSLFLDLYTAAYAGYKCKVIHVKNPGNAQEFIGIINGIEEKMPRGARYVFDSITGMQDLWGSSEQIMRFFTRQCPRLYELDTIAYWILEKNAHSEQFKAQLGHITQAVIDLTVESGACGMEIIKAENHPGRGMLKKHSYEVVDGIMEFAGDMDAGLVAIGRKVRELRQKRDLSQARLAREAGVTPSTISQVENNAINLSLQVLLRLAKALGVSIGELFEDKQPVSSRFIYRAKNRKANAVKMTDVAINSIIPDDDGNGPVSAFIISVMPETETGSHFFSGKGVEIGFLVSGSLQLEMKRRTYTLNEGDAVYFFSEVPASWKNSSEKTAKLLWVVAR